MSKPINQFTDQLWSHFYLSLYKGYQHQISDELWMSLNRVLWYKLQIELYHPIMLAIKYE
jgi:hypothetical protein